MYGDVLHLSLASSAPPLRPSFPSPVASLSYHKHSDGAKSTDIEGIQEPNFGMIMSPETGELILDAPLFARPSSAPAAMPMMHKKRSNSVDSPALATHSKARSVLRSSSVDSEVFGESHNEGLLLWAKDRREVVIFNFGCVVFWGFNFGEAELQNILSLITSYLDHGDVFNQDLISRSEVGLY